jgi:CheY-like chemotaxis protein/HPt (histidine-containing phosphotransfer) domain-containing protein
LSRRVLVVDDDPVNRLVAIAQVRELGDSADGADSGEAALAALAREPYDAVLLDCEMPGLDGYEICRRLRQEGRRTRVIALTAHTAAADRERCLAAGMDDHLGKPVRGEELAAVLDRHSRAGVGPQPPAPAVSGLIAERLAALARLGEATGEDVLAQVVESFLQQGTKNLAILREALAGGDVAAFTAAAHSLAGSSGILGAAGLAVSCAELEELARREELAACESRLPFIEQNFQQTASELYQHLADATHNNC